MEFIMSAYVNILKVIFIPKSKQFDNNFSYTTAKNVVFLKKLWSGQ